MVNQSLNWSGAQSYCQSTFNTDLADIYNGRTRNEIKTLTALYGLTEIWINNNHTTDPYDPALCDYLEVNDTLNGTEPVILSTVNLDFCTQQRPFVCSMPSELCYPSQWNTVQGNSPWSWNNDDCSVDVTNNGGIDEIQLDTFGQYEWRKMSVEYTFSMKDADPGETRAGIVFNIHDYKYNLNSPWNVFIGVLYRRAGNCKIMCLL